MSTQDQITANLIALGYSNPSVEAIYNVIAGAVGVPIDNTLTEISNSEAIITDLLISQYGLGKTLYYEQAARMFQLGDDLVINMAINPVTLQPYLNNIYAVIDTTKQIIKQAAFQAVGTGSNIQLILKVATADGDGNLIALTTDQLTAFTNYFLTFEIPGLPVSIISIDGNVLDMQSVVTYISSYDLPTLQANVEQALTDFKANFAFNGELYIGQLQDYVKQNVIGVKDYYIYNTTIDGLPFGGFINLSAGYFNYSGTAFSNITYNAIAS